MLYKVKIFRKESNDFCFLIILMLLLRIIKLYKTIMNIFDNKQLMALAINSYDFYTERQKKLLTLLVHMSIDGVVTVSTTYLTKQVSLSRPGIYLNLKKFTTEGMLSKIRKPADNQDSYCFNKEKLEHLVQLYHNKQSAHSVK